MEHMPIGPKAVTEAYLKPREVCQLLQISPRTLIRWDQEGRTRPHRLPNGYRRYRPEDVRALVVEIEQAS